MLFNSEIYYSSVIAAVIVKYQYASPLKIQKSSETVKTNDKEHIKNTRDTINQKTPL